MARADADQLNTQTQAPGFLAGGGEMGKRIRSFDWSRTPLGPTAHWPQSLKTAVRIILTSRQAMFVWWGDELIHLYNDAYKDIVGGKHPGALGMPAKQVWHEIWDEVGPRAATVMQKNKGTYDEALLLMMERNGYLEETYYTFSYSPIPGDEGGTGGIICANTDDTQRIIGGRQMALLREIATRTAAARTPEEACLFATTCLESDPYDLPFAVLYLVDNERQMVRLAETAGIESGHAAAPEGAALDALSPWPFDKVITTNKLQIVHDVGKRFGDLPTGAWTRPPEQVAVVPIAQAGHGGVAGVLVVGLSPFRIFDEDYRGFIGLLAGQVAASITNAQAHEEGRRRAEALAEIDRAKTTFFSNVSHEFRTPLTLMLGPLESLLREPQDPQPSAATHEQLDVAYRNGLRLQKLVNTLLDFSRIEADRVQAAYLPTDLAAYTTDLTSTFRSAIEKAGMKLKIEAAPLPAPVFIDCDMWEKIVLNLLSNAFKYTLSGSITVRLHTKRGRAVLEVKDTGVGIPKKELPRLFERFHRVEGTEGRTHEGSGIGLALVQQLVRLHGGDITVKSSIGKGSTFTVAIPLGSAHLPKEYIRKRQSALSAAVPSNAFAQEALRWLPDTMEKVADVTVSEAYAAPTWYSTSADTTKRPRVLLVDDNADMRGYVARLLGQYYEVETATNGREALAKALEQSPALVLTDVMMPGMDGFGLLEGLRADEATKAIPVVMLSARAGDEARIEGVQAGADDYLVKPFSARELLARVGSLIEVGRVRSQTETMVKAERQRLYELFMHAPAIVAVISGPDLTFEIANPQYHQLLGVKRQLEGRPLLEAVPDIEPGLLEIVRNVAFKGERFVANELPVTLDWDENGTSYTKYFNMIYEPLLDAHRKPEGLMCFAHEVTSQVRVRQAVEAQNRVLEVITSGAPLAETLAFLLTSIEKQSDSEVLGSILLLDEDGKHLRLGAAPSLPEEYNQAIDGTTIGPAVGSCGTAAYTGKSVIVSDIATDPLWKDFKDLALRHGLRACWSSPVCSAGRVLGTFALYHRQPHEPTDDDRQMIDFATRTAVLAIERARAYDITKESEQRLRFMAESMPQKIFTTTPEGKLDYFNPQWLEYTGASVRQIKAGGTSQFIHPDDLGEHERCWTHSMSSGQLYEVEQRLRRRDGAYRWHLTRARAMQDAKGDTIMWIGSDTDIEDIKRTTARKEELEVTTTILKEQHEQLVLLNQAKDEFISLASHQLRTPATGVKQFVGMLLEGYVGDVTPPQKEFLERANQSNERQLKIINDLLRVAQVDAGKIRLDMRAVDLATLIAGVIDEQTARFASRHQEVIFTHSGASYNARVDCERLRMVFENLLDNAGKYSHASTRITVSLRKLKRSLRISFKDEGVGIPEKDIDKLFQKFARLDNPLSVSAGGTGLGLYWVKKIVDLHGGTIRVASEPGKGAIFTVTIPQE